MGIKAAFLPTNRLAASPAAAEVAVSDVPIRKLTDVPAAPPSELPKESSEAPTTPTKPALPKQLFFGSLAALVVLAASIAGYNWYSYAAVHEETDDAYTTGHIHAIAPRIAGTVAHVLVDDNEHVHAGQVLVQLDPADYQVRVDQAKAALNVAQHQAQAARTAIGVAESSASAKNTEAFGNVDNAVATISKAKSGVDEARAAVPEAQAVLAQRQAEEKRASADFTRYDELAKQGAVSVQLRDQALRDYQVAKESTRAAQDAVTQAAARLAQSQQAVLQAQAQLQQSRGLIDEAKSTKLQAQANADQYQVAQSAIDQAQATLKDAMLQLSYTNVVSPVDGRVGKKAVEEGQRVQSGQQLMDIVADDTWVVANFKETQLERMRPGQKVEVTIDSFPHHKFIGTVDSISPGSGATFALLPPENATGNFTKIVQRVPVKILLDQQSLKGFEQLVVPGMSAVATVTVKQ